MKNRFDTLNLGKAFLDFTNEMYASINGCLRERLPDNKYRWKDFVGAREEVEAKIKETKTHLQNSIKQRL